MAESRPLKSTISRVECNIVINRLWEREQLDIRLGIYANQFVDSILRVIPFVHLRLGCPMLHNEAEQQYARQILLESIRRRDFQDDERACLKIKLYIDKYCLMDTIDRLEKESKYCNTFQLGGNTLSVTVTNPAITNAAKFVWYCFNNYPCIRKHSRPRYPCGQVC